MNYIQKAFEKLSTELVKKPYSKDEITCVYENMVADAGDRVSHTEAAKRAGITNNRSTKIRATLIECGVVETIKLTGAARSWSKDTGLTFVKYKKDLRLHMPPPLFSKESLACRW